MGLEAITIARRFRAARPIAINRAGIKYWVNRQVPVIQRWLERQPPDEPIGAWAGIASGLLEVESVDRKEVLLVDVEIGAKMAVGKWAAVLGGSASRRRWENGAARASIHIHLNGALTPHDFLDEDPMKGGRLQSVDTCTHERCLPYGLYSILTHEVTHVAESMYTRGPGYYGSDGIVNQDAYVNDPQEVRAFLQQVVEEVVRMAGKLAPHARSSQHLVDICLKTSTTWSAIEKDLQPRNRARILRAVYVALEEQGLV